MPEDYSNTKNIELTNRVEIKLRNDRDLSTYYNKLKLLLDKPDYERNEDNSFHLDEKGQRIKKMVKPKDEDLGITITDERRNEMWVQYKSLAENLLS